MPLSGLSQTLHQISAVFQLTSVFCLLTALLHTCAAAFPLLAAPFKTILSMITHAILSVIFSTIPHNTILPAVLPAILSMIPHALVPARKRTAQRFATLRRFLFPEFFHTRAPIGMLPKPRVIVT